MAVISFKCPNCDGELIFSPETGKFQCEYCDSLFTEEELNQLQPAVGTETKAADETNVQEDASEQSTSESQAEGTQNGAPEQDALIYSCPSCGAEIITDVTTAATFCYYCHNPVIMGGKLEGKYLPHKVLPFEITKEQATKQFIDYVSKKMFVPKAFFNKDQIEKVSGIYFPYWLFNVELDGHMNANANEVRSYTSGEYRHTITKHYQVERAGEIDLHNLTENALKKANAKLASGIMPYDFNKMKDFNMGYLSGFQAERRDIEREEVQGKMQQEMRESAEKLLRETVKGYSSVSVTNCNIRPKREGWFYCLFPVWTVTYKGRDGKIYYYSMNGQTGEICGELPIDKKKLTLTSIAITLVILVIGLIGGFFL